MTQNIIKKIDAINKENHKFIVNIICDEDNDIIVNMKENLSEKQKEEVKVFVSKYFKPSLNQILFTTNNDEFLD